MKVNVLMHKTTGGDDENYLVQYMHYEKDLSDS
jgi:hypothetical protein